ncbi:MAG: hypothetical protein AAFY56_12670 [Pseudomonadota bacterium]
MTIKLPPIKGMTRACGAFGQRMRRPRKGKMRVAMRMARGVGPGQIAKECRVAEDQVERWIGDDDFRELMQCCREMMDLPEEDRLKDLTQLALDLLEAAMHECDYRVAMFFYDQVKRGKNPGRVLAEDINRKVKQAAKPLDEPLSPQRLRRSTAPARLRTPAWIERPYAGALSTGRCRIREDVVRAFSSKVAAPAPKAGAKKPKPAPTNRAIPPQIPTVVANIFPKTSVSQTALLINHSRDGPR